MPGGYKTFAVGETLTAADVNNYLMEQVTCVFASAAARDAAITAPEAGMRAMTLDSMDEWKYDGTDWVLSGGAAKRDDQEILTAAVDSAAYPGVVASKLVTLDPTTLAVGDSWVIEYSTTVYNLGSAPTNAPANGGLLFARDVDNNDIISSAIIKVVGGLTSDYVIRTELTKMDGSTFFSSQSTLYTQDNVTGDTQGGSGSVGTLSWSSAKTFRWLFYDSHADTLRMTNRKMSISKKLAP